MTVFDLRPWPVRLWSPSSRWGGTGLAPAWTGMLADRLVARRVHRRERPSDRVKVLSVGNLAFGGTGKTPVVAALARDLAARGHQGAILTRGYGSPLAGPLEVGPDTAAAGDEARMTAALLAGTGWMVLQARDRLAGLAALEDALPAGSVVILEDGHQTAGVGRHLDVVILDRWRQGPAGVLLPGTGPVMPLGPWRESAAGAARAGVWLIEEPEPPALGAGGAAVTGFTRNLRLAATDGRPAGEPAAPWAALSGIARPERFESAVGDRMGRAPLLAIRCADHEAFGHRTRQRIFGALRAAGRPAVIMTAKDWIKLKEWWPDDLPALLALQDVAWTGAKALPDLVEERLGLR
jgi:tetraacyldisaccharide 4'-kinase